MLVRYILLFLLAPVILHSQIITTVAGMPGMPGYSGDGAEAIRARLNHPMNIATDPRGNIYIADGMNSVIRKVNTSGVITTIAGKGTLGYSGDGGPAIDAQFRYIGPIDVDQNGVIFICDHNNFVIRKISIAGIITTIAGNGTSGNSGDGGAATQAQITPVDVAVDHAGNVYIADLHNARIRKVDAAGNISTYAGNGQSGYSGDGGPATQAKISPTGVSVDGVGNVFIAEAGNARVRKVNSSGVISTVAGNGVHDYSGDGGPATAASIDDPYDVDFDHAGNMYVAHHQHHVIRKVNSAGIISTIVGNGTKGYSGDGGPPLLAQLTFPTDVIADWSGNIFIADPTNHTVRKVSLCVSAITPSLTIMANASSTCTGDTITFQAQPQHGGSSPVFEWLVNGAMQAEGNSFSSSTLKNGDVVSARMTSSLPCTQKVTSQNEITITILASPSVNAGADAVLSPGNQYQLNASTSGQIVRYEWTPSIGLSRMDVANPVVTISATTTYTLTVTAANGCKAIDHITLYVRKAWAMPNAFTPNGDGKNDRFGIPSGAVIELKRLAVFNRWGQVVFSTDRIDHLWDGTFRGRDVEAGTYVYFVDAIEAGAQLRMRGTVQLIR